MSTEKMLPEGRRESRQRAVTARAVIIGAATIIALSIVNPYLQFLYRSWWIVGVGSLLAGPVLVLFLLLLCNGVVSRFRPSLALTRSELITIYGMGAVSLSFLGHGGLPYLVSYVTYPFYMAGPGNQWEHIILPHIPTWLAPSTLDASFAFWEGLPDGVGVPWAAWLQPGVYWSLFTAALLAAMYALGALFSRDWIDHQRLTYPLVEVPLEMAGGGERPSLAGGLFRNRVFWIGVSLPAIVSLMNFLHRFYPNVSQIVLSEIHIGKPYLNMGLPWSVLGQTHFGCSLDILGVMCLIPSEVSLSIWLFYVLYKIQLLAWAFLGIAEGSTQSSIQPQSIISFMESGGYLALTGVLIYESRQAIKRVLLSLFGRPDGMDAYEPLSGRALVALFALANLFMLWFGIRAGMDWWSMAAILVVFYTFAIGASRLVTAGGVIFISLGANPRDALVRALGARPFSPATHVMYAYLNGIYMGDPYNLAMPQMMNSFKLVRSERINGRAFSWAAAFAVILMLAFGVPSMLKMIYSQGGTKLADWPFSMWPRGGFGQVETSLRAPERSDVWLQAAYVGGALVMLGLSWLHLNVAAWPVSPIGYVIASTWATDNILWGAALIGWCIVAITKRYGGLPLYRRLRPAFLGLVVGTVIMDAIFGFLGTIVEYREIGPI